MNTSDQNSMNHQSHQQGMNPYVKFTLMILTSTIVMFIMMYFNTYQLDHVYFSETRAYMALYMGAGMAVIMLAFMGNMYKKTKVNLLVYGISVVMFAVGIWGVRSQATVDQVDWMQAMIPHHSIAILTSSRADIEDPRVQQLADDIIKAQKREIAEMQARIEELEQTAIYRGMASSEIDYEKMVLPGISAIVFAGTFTLKGQIAQIINVIFYLPLQLQ